MAGDRTWAIKGVRDETRDAAREVAHEAGLPIGEWVDRALAGAVEEAHNPRPPAIRSKSAGSLYRFLEFFAARIRNRNTRQAYHRAACDFFRFCAGRGVRQLHEVRSHHVPAYVELLARTSRFAAARRLSRLRQRYPGGF